MSVWVASVALLVFTGLLAYLTLPIARVDGSWIFAALFAALSLSYPTMGALIVSRQPNNPVGWIFCAGGLLIIGTGCATAYSNYSILIRPEPLPGTRYMAWFADSGIVFYGLFLISALLLLLYPDGRLVSRGWRVVAWAVMIGCATWAFAWTTEPGPLSYPYRSIDNPFGVEGSARAVLGELDRISILLAFFGWVAAGVS